MKKIFGSSYTILYAVILFFASAIGLLSLSGEAAGGRDFLSYYFKLGLISVNKTSAAILAAAALIIYFFVKKSVSTKQAVKEIVKLILVLSVVLFLITFAIAKINALNRDNLKDETILGFDRALTGSYPFIFFQSIKYPAWFIRIVEISYLNLPILMALVSVYIFLKNKNVFVELASAFSLGFVLLFAIWIGMPALSPQDRFVDNVYKLPISAEISSALKNYNPQTELKNFLEKERFYKNGLQNMPTSTMPSSHVFWAFILGYYLFLTNKKLFLVFLPILILSSAGTIIFAQHYLIDVPAAVAIGILSVAVTKIYFNHLRRLAWKAL